MYRTDFLEEFETFTFESEIQPWAEKSNLKLPDFLKSYKTALRLQNAFLFVGTSTAL